MRIEAKGFQSVKRLAVPFVAIAVCPGCGKEVRRDLSDGPGSWPLDVAHHRVADLAFYCGGCEREWTETVRLSIVLDPVPALVAPEKEKPCPRCAAVRDRGAAA